MTIKKMLRAAIEACVAIDDEALACEDENPERAEALRDASLMITSAICGEDGGTDDARAAVNAISKRCDAR